MYLCHSRTHPMIVHATLSTWHVRDLREVSTFHIQVQRQSILAMLTQIYNRIKSSINHEILYLNFSLEPSGVIYNRSISPVAFYAERAYGAKLSRFLEDKFDRTYKLVLSTKDNGGDYTIEVDEELIDKSLLAPEKDKTIFSYPKTIYYQKGLVAFRFNTQGIMDSMIAESQILFEVKCVKKYQQTFM